MVRIMFIQIDEETFINSDYIISMVRSPRDTGDTSEPIQSVSFRVYGVPGHNLVTGHGYARLAWEALTTTGNTAQVQPSPFQARH